MLRKFLIPLLLILSLNCWAQSCKVFTDSGVTYYGLTTQQAFVVIDSFYSHKSLWKFAKQLQSRGDSTTKKLNDALLEISTLQQLHSQDMAALQLCIQERDLKVAALKDCEKIVSNQKWRIFGLQFGGTFKIVIVAAATGFAGWEACHLGIVK